MKTLTHEEIDQAVTTAEPITGVWTDSLFTVNPGIPVARAIENAAVFLRSAHIAFSNFIEELDDEELAERAYVVQNTMCLGMSLIAAANSSLDAHGVKK